MDKLASKILEEKLDINWYCSARLETSLTKEILQKARAAGLRMILWGFESGSKRIMELINKGIDLDKRFEILRNATEADIWNFAYLFFGFPSETVEDAQETIKSDLRKYRYYSCLRQKRFWRLASML
ncbi:MAG: radical SAM protein [Bacillus subtilis]|nr:radical SAM protein [Bacillus subtilis]